MTAQHTPDLSAYFDLLGCWVKDKISAQEGICDGITFDLYGCVQLSFSPPVSKDGKFVEGRVLDVHRFHVIERDPRGMRRPVFPESLSAFRMLGKRARDRISGLTGVVSSIWFDLCDGTVRAAISPPVDKDGNPVDGRWMSSKRIEIAGDEQVMPVPAFSTTAPVYGATPQQHTHGPADVPALSSTSSDQGRSL